MNRKMISIIRINVPGELAASIKDITPLEIMFANSNEKETISLIS